MSGSGQLGRSGTSSYRARAARTRTRRLRAADRDADHPTRVDYALTALGEDALVPVAALERACLAPGGAAALVEEALHVIDGRWKLALLFRLFAEPVRRFSELERAIPGVSQKMLAQHLRELERDGLVTRTLHAEVPPRVEYRLTAAGEALRPALAALRTWARALPFDALRAPLLDIPMTRSALLK